MGEGIVTADEHGVIESVNRAIEVMFGHAEEELRGQNLAVLMAPDDARPHHGYMRAYKDLGAARIIGRQREVVACRRSGEIFPIELAIAEITLEEGRKFIGVIRDITLRKEAEREILASEKSFAISPPPPPTGSGKWMPNCALRASSATSKRFSAPRRSFPSAGHYGNWLAPMPKPSGLVIWIGTGRSAV